MNRFCSFSFDRASDWTGESACWPSYTFKATGSVA